MNFMLLITDLIPGSVGRQIEMVAPTDTTAQLLGATDADSEVTHE
jgi:hypothetical protein